MRRFRRCAAQRSASSSGRSVTTWWLVPGRSEPPRRWPERSVCASLTGPFSARTSSGGMVSSVSRSPAEGRRRPPAGLRRGRRGDATPTVRRCARRARARPRAARRPPGRLRRPTTRVARSQDAPPRAAEVGARHGRVRVGECRALVDEHPRPWPSPDFSGPRRRVLAAATRRGWPTQRPGGRRAARGRARAREPPTDGGRGVTTSAPCRRPGRRPSTTLGCGTG